MTADEQLSRLGIVIARRTILSSGPNFSIQKFVQHPGKMFPRVSELKGLQAESTIPGELYWEVGLFLKLISDSESIRDV